MTLKSTVMYVTGREKVFHAAIRSTVVRLSSLTFIFLLTALFSCPWQPNTSQALCMWWSHCMIYRLAVWGKAVCMLGSPGEFTTACTTLSASSDTVAFQASRLTHRELFVPFSCYKTCFSLRCQDSQGLESNLFFLKGKTVVTLKCWGGEC